ncbi:MULTISPECIES: hypothetical protein [Cupriavidus]
MQSTLKTVLFISLGVASVQALAGPDWDVINRARAQAQQRNAAAATQQALLARCDEMMKQMDAHPTGSGKDGQPMMSPKGPTDAK